MAAPTAQLNGADSAGNQDYLWTLTPTSTVLPVDEYPLFRSSEVGNYSIKGPLSPTDGEYYVFSQYANRAYKRLTRTVDLRGKTSGTLTFEAFYDVEPDYDYMFVEAHTVGQDDWTTLPDEKGTRRPRSPRRAAARDGWAQPGDDHPFLAHYLDPDTCDPHGTSGDWNAATGNSGGFGDWEIDLTPFAGKQVELSITTATDPAVQGIGVFVDKTEVLADGASVAKTSFEDGLGGWTVAGPPPGSEPNANDWFRTPALIEESAAVATPDSLYFGVRARRGPGRRDAQRDHELRHEAPRRPRVRAAGPARVPGPGPAPGEPDYRMLISKSTLRVDRQRRTKVRLSCGPTTGYAVQGRRVAHAQQEGADGPAVVQHGGQQDPDRSRSGSRSRPTGA